MQFDDETDVKHYSAMFTKQFENTGLRSHRYHTQDDNDSKSAVTDSGSKKTMSNNSDTRRKLRDSLENSGSDSETNEYSHIESLWREANMSSVRTLLYSEGLVKDRYYLGHKYSKCFLGN